MIGFWSMPSPLCRVTDLGKMSWDCSVYWISKINQMCWNLYL